uniref:(northern house mosquito) hypothetical protein n=1 Tax=Culex pipiens TaxID=7175 RepID=A0A8D8B1Z4_CULPI
MSTGTKKEFTVGFPHRRARMFRSPVSNTKILPVTLPSNIRRKLVRPDSSEMTPTLRNRNQLVALPTIQSHKTKPWNRSPPNKANQRMLKQPKLEHYSGRNQA